MSQDTKAKLQRVDGDAFQSNLAPGMSPVSQNTRTKAKLPRVDGDAVQSNLAPAM